MISDLCRRTLLRTILHQRCVLSLVEGHAEPVISRGKRKLRENTGRRDVEKRRDQKKKKKLYAIE